MGSGDGTGSEKAGTAARRSARDVEHLATEISRMARDDPKALAASLAAIPTRLQAEAALRLPPLDRLELLLHAPAPMMLVRSLPDLEVYLTVREVGPSDALPLLALASADQLVHLMDLESWRGDRFDADRAGAWAALLLEAGEPALVRFLRGADDEVLALLFARWARARPIEEDDTPSIHGSGETEAGTEQGFLSPDGQHRFSPTIAEHAPAVRRIAEIFFRDRQDRYLKILWDTQSELLDEIEEDALRWRQSRLEEHGFPPWEEALSIYAPPARAEAALAAPSRAPDEESLAPRAAIRALAGRGPLARAVDLLADRGREAVLLQITSLSNHLLVADSADAGDPQSHRGAVQKGADYVGIALAARGAAGPEAVAGILRRVPVRELFREGYGRVAALQQRAFELGRTGWACVHPRALELLDSPIQPRILGLLQPRPLYFDLSPAAKGLEYRDFRTLQEIDETRIALELAEVLGRIFIVRLGLDIESILSFAAGRRPEPPRFSTLLLTALAWHAVRGEPRGEPLPPDVAREFLRTVAARRAAPPEAARAALESLVAHLGPVVPLGGSETAALRVFGLACLERLDEECGGLDPAAPPDPRFVSCLLL